MSLTIRQTIAHRMSVRLDIPPRSRTAERARLGTVSEPTPLPSDARTWAEGRDGVVAVYAERLRAPWPAWMLATLVAGSLGIAYGYAVGAGWGVAMFAGSQALGVWVLLRTAPLVRVDERVLRAGRARLPRKHAGAITALDAATARRLRGVDADASAYLCVRSFVGPAVRVEVTDPADPHPYWLVSTRHPDRLLAALASTSTGRPSLAGSPPRPAPAEPLITPHPRGPQ